MYSSKLQSSVQTFDKQSVGTYSECTWLHHCYTVPTSTKSRPTSSSTSSSPMACLLERAEHRRDTETGSTSNWSREGGRGGGDSKRVSHC